MFLSWLGYHGRSATLSAALDLPPVWLPRKGQILFHYLMSARRTVREVNQRRPAVIGLMLPPFPALVAVFLAKPRRSKVLADLHTGVFLDPKWRWCLGVTLRLLAPGHCAVVTSEELAAVCRRAGVRTFVLHDLLTVSAKGQSSTSRPVAEQRRVVVPLSYANDEPVAQILGAASLLPDVRFALTGTAPRGLKASAPENVSFTGYLDLPSYNDLLRNSDVVLALTTRDLTMQRAAYESLQAGVPVVTSDFETLRRYFGSAALFTESKADDIAATVQVALQDNNRLRDRGRERLRELLIEQETALDEVKSWVATQSNDAP